MMKEANTRAERQVRGDTCELHGSALHKSAFAQQEYSQKQERLTFSGFRKLIKVKTNR